VIRTTLALLVLSLTHPAMAQDEPTSTSAPTSTEEAEPTPAPEPKVEEAPPAAPEAPAAPTPVPASTDQIAQAVLSGKAAPSATTSVVTARVSGQVTTELYLSERPVFVSLGDGKYALRAADRVYPFYTTIQLRAEDAGLEGLSVHFQGWAGLDLADVYFDERVVADPTYLYVRFARKGFDGRLGRQMVFSGAARGLALDGLWASYTSPIHLGLELLGGLVVMPDYGQDFYATDIESAAREDFGRGFSDWRREGEFGDIAVGGRVFYQMVDTVTAGVSFLQRTRELETDHQQLGGDLRVAPAKWVNVLGDALLDLRVLGVQEANLAVDILPFDFLSFGVDYRHANPTLYLSHMSIFSVFSNEEYDAIGGNVRVRPMPSLSLHAIYHHHLSSSFSHEDNSEGERQYRSELGSSYDLQVGGRWRYCERGGVAALELRRLSQDNAVSGIRLGLLVPMFVEGLRAAGNAYVDVFDEEIRAQRVGVTGDVGLYYTHGGWRAGGALTAASTPYSQPELRGMLRLAYGFGEDFAARREP
jgi:hypothetical protein